VAGSEEYKTDELERRLAKVEGILAESEGLPLSAEEVLVRRSALDLYNAVMEVCQAGATVTISGARRLEVRAQYPGKSAVAYAESGADLGWAALRAAGCLPGTDE